MEAVLVGLLTGISGSAGLLLWYLLTAPDLLTGELDSELDDGWGGESEHLLTALRVVSAALLLGCAFATGLATTFLTATPG